MRKETDFLKRQMNVVSVEREHCNQVLKRSTTTCFICTALVWLPTVTQWINIFLLFFPFPAKFAVGVGTSHLTKPPELKNWLSSTPLRNFLAINPETFLRSPPGATSRRTLTSCTSANLLFFNSSHETSKTATKSLASACFYHLAHVFPHASE